MTKAEFARSVARMARDCASVTAAMAEGMWNPGFCASDASDYAVGFLQDMNSHLDRIAAAAANGDQPIQSSVALLAGSIGQLEVNVAAEILGRRRASDAERQRRMRQRRAKQRVEP